jgi:hypothetical protein
MSELTRKMVENWKTNVSAPGPIPLLNPGSATRLADSWLRLLDEKEAAEAEIARLPKILAEHFPRLRGPANPPDVECACGQSFGWRETWAEHVRAALGEQS